MKKKLLTFSLALVTAFSSFAQLVLPGDYPDPSVTKVGDAYWATATTSNWGPVFPLLRSDDLLHWEAKGFVFRTLPDWADYYFWAPEIEFENGKVYVYYSAHKKDGNLCLGIASADTPEGPYTDHGPLMCQEVGSIDAFPMRDENNKLYLIWKEDGNSVGKPTPIWISEMKEDRTGLIGEKRELFRNDAPWEGNLVEGVAMIRHDEYFYAFYAAAACCGRECTYATGVARAKKLLGPWEKFSRNPILDTNKEWMCPGHGTTVEKNGKFYFLYHAYHKETSVYTGRQGLLKEFFFTPDGWIEFSEKDISGVSVSPEIKDEFSGEALSDSWQWSVFQSVDAQLKNGKLELKPLPGDTPAFLGQKTLKGDYRVRSTVLTKNTNAEAGIVAIGDDQNMVGVSIDGNRIKVWKLEKGTSSILFEKSVRVKDQLVFEMRTANGKDFTFLFSLDGKTFVTLNTTAVDGSFLPPWDRAVRVGVTAKGQIDQKAVFENFILYH